MSEPKQATSRQRSAFSDAVEILNELYDEGVTYEEITQAMEWTADQMITAGTYLTMAGFAKAGKLENIGQP